MKYVETVEANVWDSSNEAQVDKIIEWLTLNAPGQFGFDKEENELRVQTGTYEAKTVRDGQAIVLSRRGLEIMNGHTFRSVFEIQGVEEV